MFIWFGKFADLCSFLCSSFPANYFNYDDLSFHMCGQVQAEKVEKALDLFILSKSVRPIYYMSLCDRSYIPVELVLFFLRMWTKKWS